MRKYCKALVNLAVMAIILFFLQLLEQLLCLNKKNLNFYLMV